MIKNTPLPQKHLDLRPLVAWLTLLLLLISDDDDDNTTFWQDLQLGAKSEWTVPVSGDTQPLVAPGKVPERMLKMLRKMLAELHYGPNSDYSNIPEPLEAAYMNSSLPPFYAGYHE